MTELTCQQCEQLAPELALKVLSDCQRGWALAHLEGCAKCRDTASALTTIANHIIELLPNVEPPAGFEQRVITALAQLRYQRHPNGAGPNPRKAVNGHEPRVS